MRRTLVVLSMILLVVPVQWAAATHRPTAACSESGDVCTSARRVDGVRKLRIVLTSKFFDRYNLCVTAPDDSKTCKRFAIERSGSQFGDSVRWSRHFPDKGSGAYTVVWRSGGEAVSARLGFHE